MLTAVCILQRAGIEEDWPEYEDDRGHGAHHPGYRRRQLRFLTMKIFSQVSSFLYFLSVVPVLRYGPNKHRFPYSEPANVNNEDDEANILQNDSLLDDGLQHLKSDDFRNAMAFAGVVLVVPTAQLPEQAARAPAAARAHARHVRGSMLIHSRLSHNAHSHIHSAH